MIDLSHEFLVTQAQDILGQRFFDRPHQRRILVIKWQQGDRPRRKKPLPGCVINARVFKLQSGHNRHLVILPLGDIKACTLSDLGVRAVGAYEQAGC